MLGCIIYHSREESAAKSKFTIKIYSMCCNFPTIKITEGNAFTLIFQLKRRSYVAERPIDKDIDVTRLSNVHVTLGGVEYAPTLETYGVRIDVPATLARGTYDGLLTAEYDGNAIRGAYESCVQIVAWNAQSNAQQYILGSPVATKAAYVLGYMPTDTEVEALKQQLRDQIAAAEQAEAEAIAEKERYAEALEHLDDIAKQGDDPYVSLTSLSEIIEGLDISQVAKQGSDSTATNTAIRDKVDEIIATIGGEADVNAVYLELLNRQTDYPADGFPSQHDLPHLPQAVAAFTPRKISNGSAPNDGIQDGTSLAKLMCSDALNAVTEIKDDNTGWTMNRGLTIYPNIKKLTIFGKGEMSNRWFENMSTLEELIAPNIQSYYCRLASSDNTKMPAGVSDLASLKKLDLRGLGDAFVGGNGNQYGAVVCGCPALTEVYFGKVRGTNIFNTWGVTKFCIQYCTALEKLSVENMNERNCLVRPGQNENLIYLQIRGIQDNSCNLFWWNPTDKGTTFLQNFREHIALRLTDNGSGLTLTLSQEVRDAIQQDPEIVSIITGKGWTISPAPTA